MAVVPRVLLDHVGEVKGVNISIRRLIWVFLVDGEVVGVVGVGAGNYVTRADLLVRICQTSAGREPF
ncbi:hypothetical protein [Streptomyces sp. NBRC 110028]|uniref:hypothetical protein n=1 Tax=Streptomyces sp. NBRC 110028 TaxID=1621260 RepID=UPI000A87BC74|nr:hypothetical protein [Streptomyces sp. NBRC 110028]